MRKILISAGVCLTSFIVFLASFKIPDLLKKNQLIAENQSPNPAQANVVSGGSKQEWIEIWHKSIPKSDLDKMATAKLEAFGFFKDRKAKEISIHEKALEKSKTASTREDWHAIWIDAIPGSDLDRVAKVRLEEFGFFRDRETKVMAQHQKAEVLALTAKAESEWREIWINAIPGSELDKVAVKKLNGFAYFEKRRIQEEIDHKRASIKALEITRL